MKLNGRNYFGARMKYDSFEQHSVDFFIKFGFAVINKGALISWETCFLYVVKIFVVSSLTDES